LLNTGDVTKPGSKSLSHSNVPALYYDKQAYTGYDLVINPAVIEPVVQFTCNLTGILSKRKGKFYKKQSNEKSKNLILFI